MATSANRTQIARFQSQVGTVHDSNYVVHLLRWLRTADLADGVVVQIVVPGPPPGFVVSAGLWSTTADVAITLLCSPMLFTKTPVVGWVLAERAIAVFHWSIWHASFPQPVPMYSLRTSTGPESPHLGSPTCRRVPRRAISVWPLGFCCPRSASNSCPMRPQSPCTSIRRGPYGIGRTIRRPK